MSLCRCLHFRGFQFTHPGGVRRDPAQIYGRGVGFNSRTREGCDSSPLRPAAHLGSFNSRTREGCDTTR